MSRQQHKNQTTSPCWRRQVLFCIHIIVIICLDAAVALSGSTSRHHHHHHQQYKRRHFEVLPQSWPNATVAAAHNLYMVADDWQRGNEKVLELFQTDTAGESGVQRLRHHGRRKKFRSVDEFHWATPVPPPNLHQAHRSGGGPTIHWPIKKEAVIEGELIYDVYKYSFTCNKLIPAQWQIFPRLD